MSKTKWMYGYFSKEAEFFGLDTNGNPAYLMRIRAGTLVKIEEIPVTEFQELRKKIRKGGR